jgi:hypothetical protein
MINTIIEFGGKSLRLTQTETRNGSVNVLFEEQAAYTSQDELSAGLKKLSEKYKFAGSTVTLCIPRFQVFLKKITMPPGDLAETRKMLAFEAERYLAFSIEMAVLDFFPVKTLSESSRNDVFIVAAKKETIVRYIEAFEKACGLSPDAVTVTSVGINNLAPGLAEKEGPSVIARFDSNNWEIDVFFDSQLVLSRGFSLSAGKNGWDLQEIKNEITNSLNMLYSQTGNDKVSRILLAKTPDTDIDIKGLSAALGMSATETELPLAVGLAAPSGQRINLLPPELQERINVKRRRGLQLKITAAAAAGALLIAGAFAAINYAGSSSDRESSKKVEANKAEILRLAGMEQRLEAIEHFNDNNVLVLDILKDVTAAMPQGSYVRQFIYDAGENTVTLRGRASSHAVASKAASQLERSGCFAQINNKGSYMTKNGDTELVDFELSAVLNAGAKK